VSTRLGAPLSPLTMSVTEGCPATVVVIVLAVLEAAVVNIHPCGVGDV
jgi:hypothetical protein